MDDQLATTLLDELQDLGVQPAQLVKRSGLHYSELKQTENIAVLADVALELAGDIGLGLRYGRRLNLPAHGVIGYALMSSGTVSELLNVIIRYNRLLAPDIDVRLHKQDDFVALRATTKGVSTYRIDQFFMEAFFASVSTCAAFLFPNSTNVGIQQFHFPQPAYQDLYRQVFNNQLEFAADYSQMLIPAELMDVTLGMAHPAAETLFRKQCDERLKSLNQKQRVSASVLESLLHRRGGFPRIGEVAARLNTSESSLRRKLSAEGTSFQALLDQVRLQLAHEYLETTRMPVSEIAWLLGFDDTANFRRAFKRWTGKTPSSYRESIVEVPE